MTRELVEHLFPVLDAASGLERVAEHPLDAAIVGLLVEDEAARLARLPQRPSRERARDVDDVLLRVAAVDAERVQLHQLAAVVFIQPSAAAQPVVEIEEHRRALRDRTEKIAKAAEDVGPDHVALVLQHHRLVVDLAGEHVEMIEPEIDEHFLELTLAVDGAQQLGGLQLLQHLLIPTLKCPFLRHDFVLADRGRRPVAARQRDAGHRREERMQHVAGGKLPRLLRGHFRARRRHRQVVLHRKRARTERPRRQRLEPPVEIRVGDGFWMQLSIDVRGDAHALDPCDVAGIAAARTEAGTVEEVDDGRRVGMLRGARHRRARIARAGGAGGGYQHRHGRRRPSHPHAAYLLGRETSGTSSPSAVARSVWCSCS